MITGYVPFFDKSIFEKMGIETDVRTSADIDINDVEYLYEEIKSEPEDRLKAFKYYKDNYMITKEDVLNELDVHIKNCHIINGYRFRNHSIGFRNSVLELLKALRDKVELTFLFDAPDDDTWLYTFEIDEESIRLNLALAHVEIESNGSIHTYAIGGDNSHTLVEVAVPKYSVKEFTDIQCKSGNVVKEVTVRQWIREGKIRLASKNGNEWEISALAEVSNDGFKSVHFSKDGIFELPEEVFPNKYNELIKNMDELFGIIRQRVSITRNGERYGVTGNQDKAYNVSLFCGLNKENDCRSDFTLNKDISSQTKDKVISFFMNQPGVETRERDNVRIYNVSFESKIQLK